MALKRPRRLRVKRIPGFSLNRLIPNILTLLALCAGMTAIRLALLGRFEPAAGAIIIAAVLDGIDGRIARLLKGTSNFGAELDSLSDFVSFGVAPSTLLYIWTMNDLHGTGWALSLLFTVCCALRLARFNTQLGSDLPSYATNFFTGVPAPAGAILAMLPMFLNFKTDADFFRSPVLNGVALALVAALMVSRVPTFSFKSFRIKRAWVLPMLLLLAAMAAFLSTEPWLMLIILGGLYIGSIPFSIRSYGRLRRASAPPIFPNLFS